MIIFAFNNKICSVQSFNFIMARTLALYSSYKTVHVFHLTDKNTGIRHFSPLIRLISLLPPFPLPSRIHDKILLLVL